MIKEQQKILDSFPKLFLGQPKKIEIKPVYNQKDFEIWQLCSWNDLTNEIPIALSKVFQKN